MGRYTIAKKYEFTGETLEHEGHTLKRIRRLSDGELGGWIESEGNLSHLGDSWVGDNAQVCGDAYVFGGARVFGYAEVCEDAKVSGGAQVYGDAKVCGDARVLGNAHVSENAKVCGDAWVYGDAGVSGKAKGGGSAKGEPKDQPKTCNEVLIETVNAIREVNAIRKKSKGKITITVPEGTELDIKYE